ncbi:MAG TPA: hypothetical protein DD670_04240 [Planctomycetaceae bacterium]|nr:hypothetical protein [Planctomycetaceae bacterium]
MKRWAWLLFAVPAVLGSIVFVLVLVVVLVLGRDGDPPDTADLAVERAEVADADNAYTHFVVAAAAIDWPKDGKLLRAILDGEKRDPEYVAEFLARNEKVFPLIERGLPCDICQLPEVHGIDDDHEPVYKCRSLGDLLSLKSRQHRAAGQFAEAAETCVQLIRLGTLIQANPEDLIHFLVGNGILGMGLDEARRLAATQDLSADELATLSGHLARIESPEPALVRAFKKEYKITSNTIDDIRDGKIGEECVRGARRMYHFQPNETRRIAAELYRKFIANALKTRAQMEPIDLDELVGHERGKAAFMLSPNQVGRIFLDLLLPSHHALLQAKCRGQGELAATRLIVACRRYEIDHGELPPTLDALVPEYLDAVPIDPFDGKPFRYVREKAIVYSVDKDLVDSGGSEKSTGPEDSEEERGPLWATDDAVFYIHGRPEKPEPSDSEKDETEP